MLLMIIRAFTYIPVIMGSEVTISSGNSLGGQLDENNCYISAGYSWCEDTQSCIRKWETPCRDNYSDCPDCLKRQINGENIACPIQCDTIPQSCNSCQPHYCPMAGPNCEYTPSIPDPCGCIIGCGDYRCHPIDPIILTEPLLASDDVCYRFCEDSSMQFVSRRDDCPAGTTCRTTMPPGMTTFDSCRTPETCQRDEVLPSPNNINDDCNIPYINCDSEYVCPKVTEITRCGEGGINGYSTYQISLVINNEDVKNIYAIFGSLDEDSQTMNIPPAYQIPGIFGSNIGGVSNEIIQINPNSRYDSWLTISLTNGDPEDKLANIGVPFSDWSEDNGMVINDGAIFVMNPQEIITTENEYIIGQLTIQTGRLENVMINVQGETKCNCEKNRWTQTNIPFSLETPKKKYVNTIPVDCVLWYDGCNTCNVNRGVISYCTKMMCFTEDDPYCLDVRDGH